MNKRTADMKNNSVKKLIMELLVTAVVLTAVILCAGCITDEKDDVNISTTSVEIPKDLHEGIHAIYNNINVLESSINGDIHKLSEQISDAEMAEDKNKVVLEYYSNNPWISCVLFYNAAENTYTSYPQIMDSQEIRNAIPFPTEYQLRKSPDKLVIHSCVFIPEHGYMNIYCKGIFDSEDNYLGYFMIFSDLYIQFNLHPEVIGSAKTYGDFVVFIVDDDNKIIYSSRQETIGQTVSKDEPFSNGIFLLKNDGHVSGAFSYTTNSFYANMGSLQTEKVTAWHIVDYTNSKYTIYAVKELNRPKLVSENAFTLATDETLKDVIDLYAYSKKNGVDKAVDYVNSGAYSTKIYVMGMDGEVRAAPNTKVVGLNYLNNRGAYGYSYVAAMIDTVKQGGGYIYYTFPIDGTVNSPASEYSLGYVLPLDENNYVMGGFPGDTDLVDTKTYLRSDITKVTREIIKEVYYYGIDYVADKINSNRGDLGTSFVSNLDYGVDDIAIVDYEGNVLASVNNPELVGNSATGYTDVYGGSTTRKAIILAKNGGGFMANLAPNPEIEGYVDLWVIAVEPLGDDLYAYVGTIIKTFKDELTPYIKK